MKRGGCMSKEEKKTHYTTIVTLQFRIWYHSPFVLSMKQFLSKTFQVLCMHLYIYIIVGYAFHRQLRASFDPGSVFLSFVFNMKRVKTYISRCLWPGRHHLSLKAKIASFFLLPLYILYRFFITHCNLSVLEGNLVVILFCSHFCHYFLQHFSFFLFLFFLISTLTIFQGITDVIPPDSGG